VLEKLKIVIRVDNLFPKKRVAEPIPQPLLDAYTAALRDSRTARYCRSRGIPRFVLESFGVGHDQLNLQMVIPVRSLVTGEVIGFDTRGFLSESEPVEKSSTLPEGGKSVAGILPFDYKQKRNIVVVEGFFDAARTYMWLLRERLNYTVVAFGGVSITPQQMEFLSGYDRIAVGYDLDSAGIRGGNKLLKELSYAPLQQLTFTGKDPGETPLDEFGLKIYI
jgi:DNA primase